MTTHANLAKYEKSIPETELPQNFKDAIYVAREIGIPYLWIDSLCILQKDGEDTGDFALEADRMADIFSSAYCVLAATSAEGMTSGFLARNCARSTVVKLPTIVGDAQPSADFYVSEILDDFESDVNQSNLHQRVRCAH